MKQITAPTLVVTCWIQQPACIGLCPPVQQEGKNRKMHIGFWIQQVITRDGAVTCWIQQPVSPKQVVVFSCEFNSGLTNQ